MKGAHLAWGACPGSGLMGAEKDEEPVASPDTSLRTATPGYQTASEEPSTFSQHSEPASNDDLSEDEEEERIDPYRVFAEAASKERERKKEADRPPIWLPGGEELDHEGSTLPDRETRFSHDAWGGRGNPQVSVRLRPLDFQKLRRAADLYGVRPTTLARMMVIRGINAILDAELRRDAGRL
jgi:hypothetical protein